MFLDPLCYGYTLDNNGRLVADSSSELLDNFPPPCIYRSDVNLCRIKLIDCCQYCKCAKTEYRNPKNVANLQC